MKRALVLFCLVACGGAPSAKTVKSSELVSPVTRAFHEEAVGDPQRAIDRWVEALETASHAPDHPASVAMAMAALDALVHHDVEAFADGSSSSALADRVPNANVDQRLAKVRARGPFVPGLVAQARLALAERRGDAKAASDLRRQTGCVREAALVGPVAWMNVSSVRDPAVLDRADGVFPAEVPGPSSFLTREAPLHVQALGCHLPLYAQTSILGVRELAVDVDVPKSGWIGVGLTTSAAATLRANGQLVLERSHAVGPRAVPGFARIHAAAGVVRLVTRVGMDQDFASIDLAIWNEDGAPLPSRAPVPSRKATAKVDKALPVVPPAPTSEAERMAFALGALASKDPLTAENLLSADAVRPDVAPDTLLVYARAVRGARDLPAVKSQERARTAYDRVLERMPSSWEAAIEHAVLAGARRGRAEARIEALADVEALRPKVSGSSVMLDAFEAKTAGAERMFERANAAFERIRGPLAGTLLLAEIDRTVHERTGQDLAGFACANGDKTTLGCHHALVAAGDRAGAERELDRLRALAGTPQLYLSLSTRSALEVGDRARAQKLIDAMNPGDRALAFVHAAKGKLSPAELLRLAPTARDAPSALPGLLRDSGDDPLHAYEGIAEKVTSEATSSPLLANAATAVLAHKERYDVEASGLMHFTMIDVRRVMGTTDVESNAQASAPMLMGRDTVRVLRRRIFKKDGRIVLPDRTPNAAQSHADLSQLEAGDAVEAIYEGWGLPNETGNIGIDTPDLLPERTTVREATIELVLPHGIAGSLWSHPMLGRSEETQSDGKRKLVWRLKDRPVRRLESGVPKMDRNVAVSWSTATWNDVARGMKEAVASLTSSSPEVTSWAREAAAGKAASKELVTQIVAASGKAVKEASGAILADVDLGRAGGHGMTARNILATHEGSRTWLVVHALRELGIPTDVVVAENEPFSDSPTFPPHFGRFMHPLAVAHVHGEDVWIDADIPGPPLPAGRVSPELRGRMALYPDGRIAALPAFANGAERDEIDIRLAVDEQGNAKGTITVLLRGHAAQDLSEALVKLVGLERQRALRGIALAWVPFATVEKVELSSSEESWQVAMRADLSAPAYAQIEGSKPEARTWVLPGMDAIHYVFPRPFVTTLASTYAAQAQRESALAINHATQYHVRRRIDLPAKAKITRLPGPLDARGPLLVASRKASVSGSSLEEDFVLDVSTGTVPREQYEAFVRLTHQADDAFRASTRVVPPR
jgi:hypothetical protein